MAKKSAKSKGYRHQSTKKPYLSKKEIAILCLVVLAVGIGAFFLFRYDDGALKVKDGAVVTEGDNWLIVNGSNARGRARYFKLGEIGEIDGVSREKRALSTDANLPEYVFTPQDAGDGVTGIRVACSHSSAEDMAKYTMTTLAAITGNELSAQQSAEIAGRTVRYYTVASHPEAAEESAAEADAPADGNDAEAAGQDGETDAGGPAAASYTRAIAGYFDAAHDSCIVVHAEGSADTAEACPTDDALLNALTSAVNAVTLSE